MKKMGKTIILVAWAITTTVVSGIWTDALAANSAVVIMYHRFGEPKYPSTNISISQFEAHLKELKSGGYAVLPLNEIIDKLQSGKPLPDRAVAITIDDAYSSVLSKAAPRLKAAGFPFTLFVSTDAIDRGYKDLLGWQQIREIETYGGTIGHHGSSHPHMPLITDRKNDREISNASRRFVEELGKTPELFAYPYGEAGLALEKKIRKAGFKAAFGQHSGAMGPTSNFYYLPRFAMNEKYGGIDRFRLVVNTLELPVHDITPPDTVITDNNPPAMGFTVGDDIGNLDRLTCFTSHAGAARIARIGKNRIEVRVDKPFPRGRSRLNCTLPAGNGRWRWLGRQFFVPY